MERQKTSTVAVFPEEIPLLRALLHVMRSMNYGTVEVVFKNGKPQDIMKHERLRVGEILDALDQP
jgi:hypothetical protein